MICFGIEATAHTFGIGIIKDKKVLANERELFTTEEGGMIPSQVADHHVECSDKVINNALKKAGIKLEDVDLFAYSMSPGIGHSLRIGMAVAKCLAKKYDKPLVGVNHCIAHLEIGRLLTNAQDPVLLYASGANTQVIAYEGRKYRIFGETLDIGIGNFIDSFARYIGLGFPGGPKVYELSKKSKNFIELPYCVKGMDIVLGGILTNLKQKFDKGASKEDLCYSLQETTYAMLIETAERAMAHCNKKELLLGGGVACNLRLQEMATKMCEARGAKAYFLENQYNVDNAAMIAHLGLMQYNAGDRLEVEEATINPYERTDQVKVSWR